MAEGERLVEPLRRLGPVVDTVRPMTYCELQTMLDGILPPGQRNYWKSSFLPDLKDDAVERVIACGKATPSHTSFLTLEPIRGVASRVPPDATAFPHRGAHCSLLILAVWTDPAKDQEHISWARKSWEAMRPFAGGSVYVNYLGDEGDERVREAYGPNYDRLIALKTKYDPDQLLAMQSEHSAHGAVMSKPACTSHLMHRGPKGKGTHYRTGPYEAIQISAQPHSEARILTAVAPPVWQTRICMRLTASPSTR